MRTNMKNMITLPIVTSLLLSGCSSNTVSLNAENAEYITHFRCYNPEKTKEHYLVNQFYRKPTADEKKCEMALAKHRIEKQLHIELVDCQAIPTIDVPDDLDKHL